MKYKFLHIDNDGATREAHTTTENVESVTFCNHTTVITFKHFEHIGGSEKCQTIIELTQAELVMLKEALK